MNFVCLDPRKTKKAKILGALNSIGLVKFFRFPPISIQSYQESKSRAFEAYSQAIRKFNNPILSWAQRKLYEWQYNGARKYFRDRSEVVAVAWNGLNGSRYAFMVGAFDAGNKRLFFEEAPLPNRITVDPVGVNFTNSLPRKISPYLDWMSNTNISPNAWRKVGKKITQRIPSTLPKESAIVAPPLSEPFLFVPLQVPNDSQLRVYGGNFCTVDCFIQAIFEASKALPSGWHMRVKAHPSSQESIDVHFLNKNGASVFLDNTTDTFKQVAASRGVITVNSSVGLEAMFYDKPVIATGKCFWGIQGVAYTASTTKALTVLISESEKLTFDINARNAFMNFITEVYYPEIMTSDNQSFSCSTKEVEKVKRRLKGSDEFGFWRQQNEL